MQATLTGFHKWDKAIGQGKHNIHHQEFLVDHYSVYLAKEVLGQEWYESRYNNKFSHWGPNAHKIECHWDCSDISTNGNGKKKQIDFRGWVRKNHPEILKEYAEVVNA